MSSQKSATAQATTLHNVMEWLKAVQSATKAPQQPGKGRQRRERQRPPPVSKLQHVTDEAVVGLQSLHTAVVRHIMQHAVDLVEDTTPNNGTKKRKVVDMLQQVHDELGLTAEWQQALAWKQAAAQPEHEAQQQNAAGLSSDLQNDETTNPMAPSKMTKAQRKRARKNQTIDPQLLAEQELMLQKSRERMLQQQQKEKNQGAEG